MPDPNVIINLNLFQWEMAKKDKQTSKKDQKVVLQKVYRQFARLKYKKYKLKYPRLRESELVDKILNQWEELDVPAKKNLGEEFSKRGGAQFLNISSSSSSSKGKKDKLSKGEKSSSEKIKKRQSVSKEKKPSPKVREIKEKMISSAILKDDSDFKRSEDDNKPKGARSTPDKNAGSSSSLKYLQKTKKIAKKKEENLRKRNEYLNFSKYYYNKLSSEHPRWSKAQVQSIVRLLWKRKLASDKKDRKSRKVESLSGRQLYRREKTSQGFLIDEIKTMWSKLPHESKLYWNIMGGKKRINRSEKATVSQVKKVLNSGAIKNDPQAFCWMNHNID